MTRTILMITGLLLCGGSQAAIWNVTSVLDGRDGGFGFSSLHEADDGSPMSGIIMTTITHATGTYNDVSGIVDFTFTLANADMLELYGEMHFNASGYLDSAGNSDAPYSLSYSGLTLGSTSSGTPIQETGEFGYLDGDVCCGSAFDPNSFMPTAVGDLHYLTLWGADFSNESEIWGGDYAGSTVGMDFRLELSQVPVPAAVYLFGSALIGLFGYQRRKLAA